jgi:hypothetical protein
MKNTTRAGIWIDHKTALLVWLAADGKTKIKKLESGFEGKERKAGEDIKFMHGGTHYMNESGFENRHKEKLKLFYKDVIACISENTELFIFGPSSAKRELSKVIREDKSLKIRIICVETADYMTEKQLAAKVEEYFELAL